MRIHITYLVLLISAFSCSTKNQQPENNPEDIEATVFVDNLLQKMTLDEKIGQTVLYSSGSDITGPTIDKNFVDYLRDGMLGALFSVPDVKTTIELQRIAVEETRLGIPLLFGYDVIHGHKTIFPISLGESASWDLDLIEKSSRIAAEEASASGFHWTFAPMIDISRDPRWGRVSEGAGEDVFLGSEIAKARVKGFQGDDLSKHNTILACAKHFAAYGAPIAGRDYNTVDMSENELRTTYLPPFKASIDAGVTTFMTSFNDLNGIPASGNKFLLTDILRDEWNFDGFVVTDYTSINEMIPHGYSKDEKHSGEQAINAGVDMDMQGGVFLRNLKKLVEEGKVSEDKINAAARRILMLKYKLGLFEDPYRYSNEQREKETFYKPEYLETARELAQKSIVLLKNSNNILPLNKNQKIAFIGPLVKDESHILGTWIARGDRTGKAISVFEGVSSLLGSSENIIYAEGCEILGNDTSKFSKAIKAANQADVVVMVLGESHGLSGEAASRSNLDLPGIQKELIAEIKKTGKPIVLVLMNGRPLTLEYENEVTDAILETWFSGTMGGAAIANVLFGEYNPSGKLTMTFPRNMGQIPVYYNHKNTGRPYKIDGAEQRFRSRYLDVSNTPLYPFGYGLSYTTFEYSNLKINKNEFNFNELIEVSVTVTNTGTYDGEEIVQLYIQDVVGSVTRPVKELKGFKKVFLKKGATKNVSFNLTSKDLAFYTQDMSFKAEVGGFRVFVGTNSRDVLETNFSLK